MLRLGVIATIGRDWKAAVERVRIAEDLGYEHVGVGEAWGASAIPFLSLIAANTQRVTLGTSILNSFSRTPAVLAQEFAQLDAISGGRMVLGIGSSGAHVIEHFHGIPFERPLRRIRETVEIFDTLIAGEPLDHDGEIFQLRRGFQLDAGQPRPRIPVWVAALTPKSIRQTGEIADGIIPIHWPRDHFEPLRQQLEAGAAAAGRADASFTIAPFTTVNVLDGTDDDATWLEARQHLWFYINRMGTFYWQMLSERGYEEEVSACRSAFQRRDTSAAIAAISERMVRDLQCIGPIEAVREQLRERATAGADLQLIYMPRGDVAAATRQLEALIA